MPFIASVERHAVHRLASTAVYPVADVALVPQALLRNLKHNQVLHERNIILTVHFAEVPHLPGSEPPGRRAPRRQLLAGEPEIGLHGSA